MLDRLNRPVSAPAPTGLRVEHLDDAVLGLGARRPRLSWQLPAGARRQEAYALEIDGQPLARRPVADRVLVPWPVAPLASRQRAAWRVKVWTDLGESEWSQPATLETGLLAPSDWSARWIESEEGDLPPAGHRPATVLRTTFRLDQPGAGARLYATAHGVYECFLNGQRVGDRELSPGFTAYEHHLHVQVDDVSPLLVAGENRWEVVLTDGWYRGQNGNWRNADCYGTTLAFLGQLHVGDLVVGSGEDWVWGRGPIVAADLMEGQVEDRRIETGGWSPVRVVEHDLERLTYSPAPPTRRVEELRPVAVHRLDAATQVVDLGQNITGWVRVGDLGPAGTELTLVHGEARDGRGDVTLEHLSNGEGPVAQTDRVTSGGRAGDAFEPRHTVHGFQYVRVEGHPADMTAEDVTGIVVHTDLRRTGWFRCSDERLNRFHEIADWSFRGNACEIPTDCPHRERSGWTGDWQVFVPSAAFLYDVAGFSLKWLRDLAAEQCEDGLIRNFAPDPHGVGRTDDPTWRGMQGSSGWGDAVVMVPWELYRAYGDHEALTELWPAMVGWVDFAAEAARTGRHHGRAAAHPDPRSHEAFLWDGGWHWGEWCEPEEEGREPFFLADQGHVGTAFLHHTSTLLGRIGRLLGHEAEADRFDALAAGALDAWRTEYLDADGSLTPDTQANHVRALAFGLVPDDLRDQTANRLVELIRRAGTHLATGFLATPYLLPVLADAGHLDVAYELLLQDTPPSWLTMVERGATTVWEDWEGINTDGGAHASLNHYSKGAVISFLHRDVAGIRLLDDHPAYRHFRVQPRPGGGLTAAEAAHDSPYGRIESSWRLDRERFVLSVTVPPDTTAEVVLPDATTHHQGPGTATYSAPTATRSGT